MHYLAVLRHGEEDERNGSLNSTGVKQVTALAESLSPILTGTGRIATSPVRRAQQTARILSKKFELPVIVSPLLHSSSRVSKNTQHQILRILMHLSQGVDAMIVVTHQEIASLLPSLYGSTILQKKFSTSIVQKGRGVLIDCLKGSVECIP